MARNPETTWEMLNVGMSYFHSYICSKEDPFTLSIIDLLFISNFKGGNASITEPETDVPKKLKYYEQLLREISFLIQKKKLADLSKLELEQLKNCSINFLKLTQRNETKIRGFGPSYASALLAGYFPDLIPILDRRVLNGAAIPVKYDKQGQVKNIISHYGQLIDAFYKTLGDETELTLRQLDKRWFSQPL